MHAILYTIWYHNIEYNIVCYIKYLYDIVYNVYAACGFGLGNNGKQLEYIENYILYSVYNLYYILYYNWRLQELFTIYIAHTR